MASTEPTPTFEHPGPPRRPSDSPRSQRDGVGSSPNYFYGFLVTFAVLLLIFVGCGIRTRRRYYARRQLLLEQLGFWDEDRGQLLPTAVPLMWDYYAKSTGKSTSLQWKSMLPLAVLPTQPNRPTPTTSENGPTPSIPPSRRLLSKWWPGREQLPSAPSQQPKDKAVSVQQFREYNAAQLAVIIQMPTRVRDPEAFPVSMIGVSEIPCAWSKVAEKQSGTE